VQTVGGIEQHRDYLFHNALGRIRDREAAEDAVQDSFLAAFAGADRFAGAACQRTWLTAILKHKVCDQVRRTCRDRALFEPTTPRDCDDLDRRGIDDFASAQDVNPSVALERKELRVAIEKAISRLPHRMAKAFSLYECDNHSGREVCETLNVSENNLWIMLHRARKQLRDDLLPWYSAAA
jgi:RNA polymerase sigma-70 factor (ECF subfamily)